MALPMNEEEILETMVDARSLSYVLALLADICQAKADHLRANWQKQASARFWQRAANKCITAANGVDV